MVVVEVVVVLVVVGGVVVVVVVASSRWHRHIVGTVSSVELYQLNFWVGILVA